MLLQHGADGATLSLLPSWETPRAETARKVTPTVTRPRLHAIWKHSK